MHTLRTGEPAFTHVFGQDVFAYMEERPELSAAFNDAMTTFSQQQAPVIANSFDFSRFGVIADVGGGHGYLLSAILRANPAASGVLFDQPHVIAGARSMLQGAGLSDRVVLVGGDFFCEVHEGADAYVLKTVLHDWSDADAEAILRRVRSAIGDRREARLLLIESVIRPGNAWDLGKLIDIEMLVTVGGRERTDEEWRTVLERANFEIVAVSPTIPPLSIIQVVCQAWRLRSEVEVLSRDPDRGNPTSMRQGRGSGFTGRSQCGCLRCGASVRAGLKEAIDVSWSRTRVKRRKASFGWVSWPPAAMPGSCRSQGRIGDVIAAKTQRLTLGDLPGSGRQAGRPKNEQTTVDGPAEVGGSRTTGRRGNAR